MIVGFWRKGNFSAAWQTRGIEVVVGDVFFCKDAAAEEAALALRTALPAPTTTTARTYKQVEKTMTVFIVGVAFGEAIDAVCSDGNLYYYDIMLIME